MAVLFVRADSGRVTGPVRAEGTLVGPFASVCSHVTLQVVTGSAAVVAVGAEVRPLTRVGSEVQL